MENTKWKLVEELDAYIIDSIKSIWLSPVDSKKSKNRNIIKQLPTKVSYRLIHLEFNEFKLKLEIDKLGELVARIYNKSLGNEYYTIQNIDKSTIYSLITQESLNNGEITGESAKVEAIFNNYSDSIVGLITENMKEYDDCFNEMVRLLNCSFKKKTKSWTPGHRYDSEKETYYYLGKYYSHKSDQFCSEFLEIGDLTPVYLVCREIKGAKKISDIFTTRSFDINGITILDKLPSMVDSGKYLTNNVSKINIRDYHKNLIDNTSNLIDKLNVLSIESSSDYSEGSNGTSYITELIKDISDKMNTILLNYWDLNYFYGITGGVLSSTALENDNIESLIKILFIDILADPNSISSQYYVELFNDYEVDLKKVASDAINNFKNINRSFENYLKYSKEYFKYRGNTTNDKAIIRTNESNKVYIKDLINGVELSSIINSLVKKSIESFGENVSEFQIKTGGTKSNPEEYYEIVITLEDIRNYINNQFSENLKQEILNNYFQSIKIEISKDEEVK